MSELSEADKRRVQKHELLQKFRTVKKSYYWAAVLCFAVGATGAHRWYLGQTKLAITMAVGWFAVLIIAVFWPVIPWIYGLMSYGVFILIEQLQIIKTTDEVNERIKKSLEEEFYL